MEAPDEERARIASGVLAEHGIGVVNLDTLSKANIARLKEAVDRKIQEGQD